MRHCGGQKQKFEDAWREITDSWLRDQWNQACHHGSIGVANAKMEGGTKWGQGTNKTASVIRSSARHSGS
jgi:hypothetical protein